MHFSTATIAHPMRLKQPTQRWIVMGDSLVYGFGDPIGGGWVERLRRQWMSPDCTDHVLYNLGVRGDGINQVLQRLETEFRLRGEVRNRLPDALILSVGTNDSPRLGRSDGRNFLDFAAFQGAIGQLLDQAQGLCPVYFVGMVPVNEAAMPFLDCLYYNHADQFRYKEATRKACEQRGIPYLDLFERWMAKGTTWCHQRLTQDGLHPNALGYETMLADVLAWDALAALSHPQAAIAP
ncbi:G-D-S-L family lipolytic protein [Alkalinema sp. FACHB-956]|nr:GDSL-type esterase/lipase family protein [Alkalinema sp. FACHB-956]MBD2328575.1 G-D-S-L family lipolytic protein [Alkalinema sp. FACHB-956]